MDFAFNADGFSGNGEMRCTILGAPVQDGSSRKGCEMGPSALRVAGLAEALTELGHEVEDLGTVAPAPLRAAAHPNAAIKALPEIAAWTEALAKAAYEAGADAMPIFLGGDHSISAGTLSGVARRAAERRRPLFVRGSTPTRFPRVETPAAATCTGAAGLCGGLPGFRGYFPELAAPVDPRRVCTLGLRSVDPAERAALAQAGVTVHDMRAIDEHGIAPLLRAFLGRVAAADGLLHVSLDVDFLDPAIAPAVGTTVPGGATFREAHLVMEMLSDSGLVASLDLVELNPFLDERGRTATLMVDLTASLMGRRVMDRPTQSY